MPNQQSRRNAVKNLLAGTAALSSSAVLSSFSGPKRMNYPCLKEISTTLPAGGAMAEYRSMSGRISLSGGARYESARQSVTTGARRGGNVAPARCIQSAVSTTYVAHQGPGTEPRRHAIPQAELPPKGTIMQDARSRGRSFAR